MSVGTEHGGSIAFGTTGGTYLFNEINGHKETGDDVDITHLGTTGARTSQPGDLITLEPFDVEIQFDNKNGLPPANSAPETITITKKLNDAESVAATLVGTGWIKDIKYPDHKKGSTDLARAVLTVKWDGFTEPAFTAAT